MMGQILFDGLTCFVERLNMFSLLIRLHSLSVHLTVLLCAIVICSCKLLASKTINGQTCLITSGLGCFPYLLGRKQNLLSFKENTLTQSTKSTNY